MVKPKVNWMGLAAAMALGLYLVLLSPIWAAEMPTVYVMQADDRLEKLAEKYYNDPLAYPTIMQATNAQATTDDAFTQIETPAQVAAGQLLYIPTLSPGSDQIVLAETLPVIDGPTAEQQALLASLKSKGAPPELFNEVWLNSEPLKLEELKGKVVIVEFWTYG
jgi:hypothetical protein